MKLKKQDLKFKIFTQRNYGYNLIKDHRRF